MFAPHKFYMYGTIDFSSVFIYDMNMITKTAEKRSIRRDTKHKILLTLPKPIIPDSLEDTAGILKDRYTDLKRHIKKMQSEWR